MGTSPHSAVSVFQDARAGNSLYLFVRMSPLSAALRKKNSALYVDIKSACAVLGLLKLELFLTIESKWTSTAAATFA